MRVLLVVTVIGLAVVVAIVVVVALAGVLAFSPPFHEGDCWNCECEGWSGDDDGDESDGDGWGCACVGCLGTQLG